MRKNGGVGTNATVTQEVSYFLNEEQDSRKPAEYPFQSTDSEVQFTCRSSKTLGNVVIAAARTLGPYSAQGANPVINLSIVLWTSFNDCVSCLPIPSTDRIESHPNC